MKLRHVDDDVDDDDEPVHSQRKLSEKVEKRSNISQVLKASCGPRIRRQQMFLGQAGD